MKIPESLESTFFASYFCSSATPVQFAACAILLNTFTDLVQKHGKLSLQDAEQRKEVEEICTLFNESKIVAHAGGAVVPTVCDDLYDDEVEAWIDIEHNGEIRAAMLDEFIDTVTINVGEDGDDDSEGSEEESTTTQRSVPSPLPESGVIASIFRDVESVAQDSGLDDVCVY
ncbi:hypothetical protein FGB62_38g05 [Gracilaria domingensis]|nr:hypothetical protein FGB62_38g05 [Gracilaria domingensis]